MCGVAAVLLVVENVIGQLLPETVHHGQGLPALVTHETYCGLFYDTVEDLQVLVFHLKNYG